MIVISLPSEIPPPQIYVYARNARFFESDEESANKILEGHGETTNSSTGGGKSAGASAEEAASKEAGGDRKLAAPSAVGVPGLVAVTGPPLTAPAEGSLSVVFFFATWCMSCEKVLPAILSVAARYSEEGEVVWVWGCWWEWGVGQPHSCWGTG